LETLRFSPDTPTITLMNLPEGTFKGLKKLKEINLSNNKLNLNNVHPRTFDGLTSLQSLILTGNLNPYNPYEIKEIRRYCKCNVNVVHL
jgi:hypothetical protein